MDDYLQYMRNLRSQMNDVEDQAAKTSADEQTLITTIHTLQNDLQSEKAKAKRLAADIEIMVKAKGQICTQILERQRKIASLESDSSTLVQTLDLLQQEKAATSSKLVEKRSYYDEVSKNIAAEVQNQKEWLNSNKDGFESGTKCSITEATNTWRSKLESVESELKQLVQLRSDLVLSINKTKESLERAMCNINNFGPDLRAMDIGTLKEELQALVSDKSQESEYLSSVHNQLQKIKGLSKMVTCACGHEFKVDMGTCSDETDIPDEIEEVSTGGRCQIQCN